jgi:hypothetical protein
MGVLQVAHGCVEKTADEQGLLRGVEASTIEQMEAPIQAGCMAIAQTGAQGTCSKSDRGVVQAPFTPVVFRSATLVSKVAGWLLSPLL